MFIFIISTSSWHGIISISSSLCVRNDETNSFSFFHTSGRNCYAIEDTILFSTSRKNSLPNLFSLVLSYRSKRIANYSYRITLSIEITAVSPLTGRAMAILMWSIMRTNSYTSTSRNFHVQLSSTLRLI